MRVALMALCLVACGDQAEAPTRDAPLAVDAAVCGPTTLRGVVRAFSTTAPFEQWARVSGVKVCDEDRPWIACAVTDSSGAYVLPCMSEGEAVISFSHPSFLRTAWPILSFGAERTVDAVLLTESQNVDFYAPVNVTYPRAGYGVVGLNEVTHQVGIMFSAQGAEGPFYSRDGVSLDPSATGTVGDGLAFFIAPVGTLTIEITPVVSMQICGHAAGAFQSTGHGLTVPVYERTETDVYVACR